MVNLIVWIDLTIVLVIMSALVSWTFIQDSNNGDTDGYGRLTFVVSVFYWSPFYCSPQFLCLIQWKGGVIVRWFLVVDWWWYYDFGCGNFAIGYCRSKFCSSWRVPGDISWDNLQGYFVSQENSSSLNCPGIFPRIVWYFCTLKYTDLVSSYAKRCIRYNIFLYICHSTSQ